AWGGFAGLSKELGSKHQLQLTAVYAPVIRGKASPATLEVYQLAGDPYYNSYWGYQQGEKRNSRWSERSVPMLTLNYNGRWNDHLSWSAGGLGLSGTFADGQLDWYNAPDPRPDYYQKLPSYIQDSTVADAVRLSWKVNPNVRQINWDRIYQINYNNQDTIRNANGIPNQTVTGRRAAYWLSERHADPTEIEHFASVKYSKGPHDLMLAYRGEWSKTAYYLKAYDLLGADFMVDLEDFATLPEQQHPDIRQKNHVIREGGKYAYDYSAHNQNYSVHGNYSYAARKWDAAIGALVQRRSFYRKSDLENAIFQNSYGKSETLVETGLGLKTLLTWKFNGRNYLQANGAYQMLPNRFDQSFINPQWRGDVLEHNDRTKVYGGDISYYYRDPGLKIQLTAYWLRYEDQILNKNFYLDDQLESASNAELTDGSLISAFFTGLDQQHQGVEAAVEWNVGWGFELSGVYMLGDHRYTSRPDFIIFDKFSGAESRHVIYLKNFFVPGTAQQAASFSLTYNFRKSGFAVLSFANVLSDQYLEPNPLRRISEAVRDVDPASARFRGIIDQQKLPSAYFVNAFVYKGFRIFKQNLSMSLSVNNLLNKKDILSGGFEQYRFDYETRDPSKFPPKYYYLQGINYYLGINWRYDFSK
ncbi:MAG TPA: hypothetical protein VFX48_06525, partial [Saprospiraceae bacterium]|nr:hypothetical protein [Saprospiraceae bacterium]